MNENIEKAKEILGNTENLEYKIDILDVGLLNAKLFQRVFEDNKSNGNSAKPSHSDLNHSYCRL